MNNSLSKSGFTLVELLVVISIILIASSIIFIGGTGGDGAKLSSAQRILSGVAQGARGQAILKNTDTRLIIYSDDASNLDDEKKLRFFGIVYWGNDVDENGVVTATGWKAATQGTFLPEGIYFNEDLSKDGDGGSIPTMTLDYPRIKVGDNKDREDGGGGEQFFFYEFSPNGTMAPSSNETKSTDFSNAWLALQAGTLKPGTGDALEVDFTEEENENLKSALIFRRTGTTTPVNDPQKVK
jgi:prepilin-type N-terminal cleavage/methylation domain-containing protein